MPAFNFPSSPTIGQISNGYAWDGEKWVLSGAAATQIFGAIRIQKFTASGTYTPHASMVYADIECVGGGGAGGSTTTTTVAPTVSSSAGGGGGAYAYALVTRAMVGASQTVTIGLGGAAAAASFTGNPGGTTSVGSLCSAGGGAGGGGSAAGAATYTSGAAGGTATVGDLLINGQPSTPALGISAPNPNGVPSNGGASGRGFGGGGVGLLNAPGSPGLNYGGGGGGNLLGPPFAAQGGGVGAAGIVIITEYCTLSGTTSAVVKKNYIGNGGMQISQENGSTALTTTSTYPVDQFMVAFANAGTQTFQQVASVTPAGSPNRLRVTATVADAAVGATDYLQIYTKMEGLRVADLRLGTASAKTVTLQFGCRGPAGTYCVGLFNGANNRTYISEYTISAGEANTDVVRSVTVPGDITGTWAVDNTTGLGVNWSLMNGSAFQQAAGSWGTVGSAMGTSNQFNFMGTNGNVFELFDVGLYEGTVAPAFQVPDYISELAACQRYYEIATGSYRCNTTSGGVVGTHIPFKAEKRTTTPTMAYSGNGPSAGNSAFSAFVATSHRSSNAQFTGTANTDSFNYNFLVTVNARL
jgi:hypothetical protein